MIMTSMFSSIKTKRELQLLEQNEYNTQFINDLKDNDLMYFNQFMTMFDDDNEKFKRFVIRTARYISQHGGKIYIMNLMGKNDDYGLKEPSETMYPGDTLVHPVTCNHLDSLGRCNISGGFRKTKHRKTKRRKTKRRK